MTMTTQQQTEIQVNRAFGIKAPDTIRVPDSIHRGHSRHRSRRTISSGQDCCRTHCAGIAVSPPASIMTAYG